MKKNLLAKLIVGAIYSEQSILEDAIEQMRQENLIVQSKSAEFSFDLTEYYSDEMGNKLKRSFLSIEGLQKLESSFEWKLKMLQIENHLSISGRRKINLDPGYLDSQKIVLLSRKEGPHKIYLCKGVWADLVLLKVKGGYQNLPWTFPDLRDGKYNDFFLQVLEKFKKEKKSL